MKLTFLFLTVTILFSTTLYPTGEKREINIQFYKKGTNSSRPCDHGYMGRIGFSDVIGEPEAYIYNLVVEREYARNGLMNIFMAYALAYIHYTNPTVKIIKFHSQSTRLPQNVLDEKYRNTGAVSDSTSKEHNGFIFDIKKIDKNFLKLLTQSFKDGTQIFKNINVKIMEDRFCGAQINETSDISSKL